MAAIDVNQLKAKAGKALSGFSTGQKVVTGLAVVGLVIGGMMFSSWASKPSYAPLFTNLQPSDAASITQKLTSGKVQYQLADGGGTIMVPQSVLYQQRIAMSAAGLPAGGTDGYKLLDKQGITTSEFTQHVNYQRALEGELSKTIGAIDGVGAATVHLVIPQQDVFSADTNKPSASVLVQNLPGKTLSAGQVQAIVHLVSSSVEGLSPDDVSVADAKGNLLSAPGDGGDAAAGDARSSQTKTYEDDLSKSLQDMLTQVIGPNHAVVRVTADLNFDQKSTTTETYDHNPAPVISQSTSSETYNGAGAPGATGTLGAGTAATTASGNASLYTKTDNTQTNAVGKVTEQTKQAPGAVNRLSIAVALDSNVKTADANTVTQLVSAAAGINAQRGDTVVVNPIKFDDTATKTAQKELSQAAKAKSQAGMMSLAKTVGVLLLVGMALLLVLRSAKKTRRVPLVLPSDLVELDGPRAALGSASAIPVDASEPGLVGLGAGGEFDSLDAVATRDLPAAAVANSDIVQLIERQPDEVASLLRSWLADRRENDREPVAR